MQRGSLVCKNCGSTIKYVKGERFKLSSPGIPEVVSVREDETLTWSNEVYCKKCGGTNRIGE